LPSPQDHVLHTVFYVDEALLVNAAQVTGSKPTIHKGCVRCLWVVPVSTNDGGTLDPYFTNSASLHGPSIVVSTSALQNWRVGTPTKFVTCSRSISSKARTALHLCIRTSVRPLRRQLINTELPVTWKSGVAKRNTGRPVPSLSGERRCSMADRQANPSIACNM